MNAPLLILLAFLFAVGTASAQSSTPLRPTSQAMDNEPQSIDPAKAAEIRKMFELTGMVKSLNASGDEILSQLITYLRQRNGEVPVEFWDHIRQEFSTADVQQQIMLIYNKYYSLDDLKAMNAFYSSPAGQHMFANSGQIMRESQQAGKDWGADVSQKIVSELNAEKQKAAASTSMPIASPSAPTVKPATMLSPRPAAPVTPLPPGQ